MLTSVGGQAADSQTIRRARTRYIARMATTPHARCAAAGRCVEPVPREEQCR